MASEDKSVLHSYSLIKQRLEIRLSQMTISNDVKEALRYLVNVAYNELVQTVRAHKACAIDDATYKIRYNLAMELILAATCADRHPIGMAVVGCLKRGLVNSDFDQSKMPEEIAQYEQNEC
jgi:hypothetical protein